MSRFISSASQCTPAQTDRRERLAHSATHAELVSPLPRNAPSRLKFPTHDFYLEQISVSNQLAVLCSSFPHLDTQYPSDISHNHFSRSDSIPTVRVMGQAVNMVPVKLDLNVFVVHTLDDEPLNIWRVRAVMRNASSDALPN